MTKRLLCRLDEHVEGAPRTRRCQPDRLAAKAAAAHL
jgi:hypothetical protein